MIMLWSAIYDLFDLFVGIPGPGRAWAFVIIGVLGIIACHGTLDNVCYVYTDAVYNAETISWETPAQKRAVEVARATLCLVFQDLVWLGSWNISGFGMYTVPGGIDFYPIAIAFLGIITLLLTKSYIGASFIAAANPESQPAPHANVLHRLRSLLAYGGYIATFNGYGAPPCCFGRVGVACVSL
jgi:hypothetical protein